MTYGLSVINDFGVEIFDTEHPTLVVRYEGTTVDARPGNPPPSTGFWSSSQPMIYQPLAPFDGAVASPSGYEWVASGSVYFSRPAGLPPHAAVSDTVFYQLSGHSIDTSVEAVFDLGPSFPLMPTACVGHIDVIGVPFKVAGVLAPGHVPTGYGLAIWDAAGECLFDSNAEFLAIRYACIVPKAKFDDILDNGVTVDITLPEAMPDAWIALPIHAHIRRSEETSTGRYRYPIHKVSVTQINPTTVRLSRHTYPASGYIDERRSVFTYTHDTILYFARSS